MSSIFFSTYTLVGTSLFSRSMMLSLTCSLLVHVTAFAFSYRWNILSTDKPDQPLRVELIDVPMEPEQSVAQKSLEQKHRGEATVIGGELKREKVHHAPSLMAKSDSPPLFSPEIKKGNAHSYEAEVTVALDSQDLKYVSYLTKIKKKIEPKWHYPERAQQIGLQGRLALYFSITRDGNLTRLVVVNSSGHPILDEGALNAVREASPYYPLPERLNISRLNILATFEYKISPYSMSRFSQTAQEKNL